VIFFGGKDCLYFLSCYVGVEGVGGRLVEAWYVV